MLTQIVRPMVRTQIRLLANSQATRSTLVTTIAQWLGFLGVHAQVTQLDADSDRIHVSLTVGKPEGCDTHDWQQIVRNLKTTSDLEMCAQSSYTAMNGQQQSKLQRLLAYVIQIGDEHQGYEWEQLQPQLIAFGFDEGLVAGIRSALKVPQSLELLMDGLDADVAAIALPKAVSIALLDRKVNSSEDKALSALLDAMKQSA
ncbi:MAG: hypothetical protein IGR76_13715 [Synechococcales cyanobacterium T60_A2020_003]|nr:hypothetical protein [Synechococcales cyanobacterium T60_A2020_003]